MPDSILLFFRYSKTQKMKGRRDGISRFLPPQVAILLARFLSQVKPLEARFLGKLGDPTDDTKTFLFTKEGEKLGGDQVNTIFKDTMTRLRLPLGFQEYRHAAIGLNREDIQRRSQPGDEALFAALQCGHSEETESVHYAIATQDHLLAPDLEHGYRQLSTSWQKQLKRTDPLSRQKEEPKYCTVPPRSST